MSALCAAVALGSAVGSPAAGFLLIPAAGAESTLAIGALAFGGAAVAVFARNIFSGANRLRLSLALLMLGAAFAALPRWNQAALAAGVPVYPESFRNVRSYDDFIRLVGGTSRLLYCADGWTAVISVDEDGAGRRFLRADGRAEWSTDPAGMEAQCLRGYIPLFFHPDPQRALVLGFGSGITAGAISDGRSIRQMDCVDPEMALRAASLLFMVENHQVYIDRRTQILRTGGRLYLACAVEPYDLIVALPSDPWVAGAERFYTREAFAQARAALAPGGIYCQRLPACGLSEADLKAILRTFLAAFPNAQIFGAGADFLMMGVNGIWNIDTERIGQRMRSSPAASEALRRIGIEKPSQLVLRRLALANRDLRAYVAAAAGPVVDDRPRLELAGARNPSGIERPAPAERLRAAKTQVFPDGLRGYDSEETSQ